MFRATAAAARLRPTLLWAIAVIALVGCTTPAVAPATSAPSIISAAQTADASSSPPLEPGPSPSEAPSTTTLPTATPMPTESTPAATVAPKPSPTLNWDANGCQGSVRDPVKLGAQAKVTLKCPVGPTCTLKITYPSGGSAKVGSPSHPNPGWWVWTWTVPTSAKGGDATGTSTCTYAGNPHTGPVSFTLVAPATNFDIQVHLPATFDHTTPQDVGIIIQVTITGTLPESPGHAHQAVWCDFHLTTTTSPESTATYNEQFVVDWDNGDPPITWRWRIAFGPNEVGHATWDMKCTNYYIHPPHWEEDTGTLEIT